MPSWNLTTRPYEDRLLSSLIAVTLTHALIKILLPNSILSILML